MKKRIITGFVIACALALLFASRLLTPYIFDIFIGFLACGACVEMARVLEKTRRHPYLEAIGIFPAVLFLVLYFGMESSFSFWWLLLYIVAVALALCFVSMIVSLVFYKATKQEMEKHGLQNKSFVKYIFQKACVSFQIMMYPGFMFGLLFILNHLSYLGIKIVHTDALYDWFLLVLIFAITTVTDTMAMLTGMLLKGPKLCPKISPKKTISGAIGGLIGGILSAVITYICFDTSATFHSFVTSIHFSIWIAVAVGIAGSIFCQLGDILASLVKRRAGVKDYGTIFPGHGGVMDRVDGLVFTTILVFLVGMLLV